MPDRRSPHDLLFAHDFPPMDGGIARWMAAIADGYPAGTLVVSTGAFRGSAATDAASPQRVDRIAVPVNHLGTMLGGLRWSRRAIALARDPAARFAWCDTIRPAAYTAQRAFRRTGLPFGIMVVGNDLLTLRVKVARLAVRRRLMQSILSEASVFVAISDWTATACRTLLGELGLESAVERVRVVPLGTDPARFRLDAAGAMTFQRQRGLPHGQWLVTVARLVEYKGIDTAIRVVARLANDYSDLRYAVIGRGPHEAALRALAAELGVAERVHLLTDVTDDELPAAYSLGTCYLGLTRETSLDVEGFGISFAEAAACGLPVIGARSGGIPDAVVDGETGVLVDPDDAPAIEHAVRRLLGDPVLARRMGTAGRERVERYLNWGRVVQEMRAIADEFGRTTATS